MTGDNLTALLEDGVEEVIVKAHLEERLKSGAKLRIKLGIDPTASILHLGHAVVLHKLKQFQDLGHQVIFLIGDFTAQIGDPSGRTAARPTLSPEQIEANLQTYIAQAGLILDRKQVEIRRNSEWLAKMSLADWLGLAQQVTLSQVAHRADFKERIDSGADLSLQEFMYPVLQGYDSVQLKADVEIGGTDQKFNLLLGRQIQKRYGQEPQDIITCPLLEGLTGGAKMSKSLNNYVALTAPAAEMYGQILSLKDSLIPQYFKLAAFGEVPAEANPRDAKMRLAREIVTRYHGSEAATAAEENFVNTFSKKIIPADLPEIQAEPGEKLSEALIRAGVLKSKSDWRRLIKEGAIHDLDTQKALADPEALAQAGLKLKIGKKRFVQISLS